MSAHGENETPSTNRFHRILNDATQTNTDKSQTNTDKNKGFNSVGPRSVCVSLRCVVVNLR